MSTESRERLRKLLDREFSIVPVKAGGRERYMVDYFRHGLSAARLLAETPDEAVEKALEVLSAEPSALDNN